ncbi:MAG: oligopeptide/dipeptide ABC transporter ATP-binding protein [Acidilobus sp.]
MIAVGRGLKMYFPVKGVRGAYVRAVDNVDIEISEGEIVGLVGESGSGKSTLGRLLIRLLEPTAGDVFFNIPDDELERYDQARERGDNEQMDEVRSKYSVMNLKGRALKEFRRNVGIVFQDPYSSLDSRLRIADIIAEPLVETGMLPRDEAMKRVVDLLEEVQLPPEFADRYPHELSGGQRQRVAIARGIATNPRFVVLDEPTSALDVSVQAEILELLRGLRETHRMAMLLITHNISVVSYMSDRIYVMYAGMLMERGSRADIIRKPTHPYTQALISAVPEVGKLMRRIILKGDVPSLVSPPKGCRFHPRCPVAIEKCGWTADEVAEALMRVLETRYPDLASRARVRPVSESALEVRGLSASEVKDVVSREAELSRGLIAVSSVTEQGGRVIVNVAPYEEPRMASITRDHFAACHLVRPSQ